MFVLRNGAVSDVQQIAINLVANLEYKSHLSPSLSIRCNRKCAQHLSHQQNKEAEAVLTDTLKGVQSAIYFNHKSHNKSCRFTPLALHNSGK